MEHYECEGECVHDGTQCGHMSPDEWECTRPSGHTGPHVAYSSDGCNIKEWENQTKRHVPLTREEGVWSGPITITMGRLVLEITTPEVTLISVDDSRVSLQPDDIKRFIRALVMASNLQRTPNPRECDECEDCEDFGYHLNAPSEYPVQRCDSCQQFDSDYAAWLSLIPDETRLSGDDDE